MNTLTNVLDVNGDPIPLAWALEFGGYLMADGCIYLSRSFYRNAQEGGQWMYRPQISINQRADSRPLLEVIQARLGGHIRDSKGASGRSNTGKLYQSKPTSVWITTSCAATKRILALLDYLSLPHAKMAQAKVMREYLGYRSQFGKRLGDEAREHIHQLYQELRELKRYSSE